MNEVELYWDENHTHYAVLVSYGFGAGWSSWKSPELAYDKRIVKFWLAHKDDEEWMCEVNESGLLNHAESIAHKEAREFFKSIGYEDCPYMGGFSDIGLEWVPKGVNWRINEYDGAESIEYQKYVNWNCY